MHNLDEIEVEKLVREAVIERNCYEQMGKIRKTGCAAHEEHPAPVTLRQNHVRTIVISQ